MATSRSFGGTWLTTRSPMRISPAVMFSRPAIMRSKVDLPQPDGPTRTTNSPSRIATEAIHTSQAGTAAYTFFFVFSAILAGGGWTISRTKSSFFRPPKCKPDLIVVGQAVGAGAPKGPNPRRPDAVGR